MAVRLVDPLGDLILPSPRDVEEIRNRRGRPEGLGPRYAEGSRILVKPDDGGPWFIATVTHIDIIDDPTEG